mgnify:CR=1 FL=1
MQIQSFTAGPWQTNCYIVSHGANSECLIIDPGMKAATGVRDVVRENNLKPVAVLVTHGHIDHMWSVFPVASGYGIPALVHGADRELLANPGLALSNETRLALPTMMDAEDVFADPEEVIEVTDKMNLSIAGFDMSIHHAPGHTHGSVMFDFAGDTEARDDLGVAFGVYCRLSKQYVLVTLFIVVSRLQKCGRFSAVHSAVSEIKLAHADNANRALGFHLPRNWRSFDASAGDN